MPAHLINKWGVLAASKDVWQISDDTWLSLQEETKKILDRHIIDIGDATNIRFDYLNGELRYIFIKEEKEKEKE